MIKISILLMTFSFIFFSVASAAPPDAGSLQQQFRPFQNELPPEQFTPEVGKTQSLSSDGPRIRISSFSFKGNTLITDEKLNALLRDYIDRELNFAGLQMAAAAVGDAYQQSGWLANVYIPQQEVFDGQVTLEIIESRFGEIIFDGNQTRRFPQKKAAHYVTKKQQSQKFLNTKKINRALLLLDDVPGITASGNLTAGTDPAETDLLLSLANEPLISGQISLDNHGSRSTGHESLTLNTYVNSPFKIGDQIRSSLTFSEGSRYVWLNYSLPVGFDGLRIGVNGSCFDYEVVTPDFNSLDLEGDSRFWGLNVWYPLLRLNDRNLYVGLDYENKSYYNSSNTGTSSDYQVHNGRFTLTGNLFDRFGGGGANLVNLTITSGDVDLGQFNTGETASLDGTFSKLNYYLSRQQAISNRLSLFISLFGQVADGNLDSSAKFYLGGPYGVRAYPVNEGGGDEGTLARLELRYRVRGDFVLTGFYDWGQVTQNKGNQAALAAPNRYELSGAGVALNWSGPRGLIIQGTYARRINNNPNPTNTGKDEDGSLHKNRFWLSASLPF